MSQPMESLRLTSVAEHTDSLSREQGWDLGALLRDNSGELTANILKAPVDNDFLLSADPDCPSATCYTMGRALVKYPAFILQKGDQSADISLSSRLGENNLSHLLEATAEYKPGAFDEQEITAFLETSLEVLQSYCAQKLGTFINEKAKSLNILAQFKTVARDSIDPEFIDVINAVERGEESSKIIADKSETVSDWLKFIRPDSAPENPTAKNLQSLWDKMIENDKTSLAIRGHGSHIGLFYIDVSSDFAVARGLCSDQFIGRPFNNPESGSQELSRVMAYSLGHNL